MVELVVGYVLIFFARVFDVSCCTVRMLLLVRGRRGLASLIGFFEVFAYILVLMYIVDELNDPLSLLVYSLGFAAGNYVGSILEEKLAMGYTTVQVIPCSSGDELVASLREDGFGVTTWEGHGHSGLRSILNIIVTRKQLPQLINKIEQWDSKAFVTVLDARLTKGGFFFQRKGK